MHVVRVLVTNLALAALVIAAAGLALAADRLWPFALPGQLALLGWPLLLLGAAVAVRGGVEGAQAAVIRPARPLSTVPAGGMFSRLSRGSRPAAWRRRRTRWGHRNAATTWVDLQ